MRNLVTPAVAFAAVLLPASAASAQYYVEADLNGVLGDPQPDNIVTTVGQEVPVDVWFLGPPNWYCCAFEALLCEPVHALTYQSAQFHLHGCWGHTVEGPDSTGCLSVGGADFCLCDLAFALPYRVVTVTYAAAVDETIAELTLGSGSGAWLLNFVSSSSSSPFFDNNGDVLARIQIGDVTSTEATSWGSVKALFR